MSQNIFRYAVGLVLSVMLAACGGEPEPEIVVPDNFPPVGEMLVASCGSDSTCVDAVNQHVDACIADSRKDPAIAGDFKRLIGAVSNCIAAKAGVKAEQ